MGVDSPQTPLVEGRVMRHKRQSLDSRSDLAPHVGKRRCILGIAARETVDRRSEGGVIVGVGTDQPVDALRRRERRPRLRCIRSCAARWPSRNRSPRNPLSAPFFLNYHNRKKAGIAPVSTIRYTPATGEGARSLSVSSRSEPAYRRRHTATPHPGTTSLHACR